MGFGNREPPGLQEAFGVTFLMMFREEWRQNVDFAKRRNILMFPVMLALFSLILTVGLRFLTGEVLIDPDSEQQAFSWDQLKFFLHAGMFMFALSMGSFAFIGRVMVSQRAGGKNYLLASPAMQPLDQGERLKVKRLHLELNTFGRNRLHSLYIALHGNIPPVDYRPGLSPGPLLRDTIGGADENEFKYQDESGIYPFG